MNGPAIGVHDWSLHRTLGRPVAPASFPWGGMETGSGGGALALLELPAELRRGGYDTVQLCHFHLPSRDAGYLAELRGALADAEVRLDALLIDTGDLTHPSDADEHEAWIGGWIDDAVLLGAERTRVIAGQQQTTSALLQESARRLVRLAQEHPGSRIVTENWFALLAGPAAVLELFDRLGDEVGLLLDLANWTGPTKHADLRAVAHLAETCHAKANLLADGVTLDEDDYRASVAVLRDVGFTGTYALVFDGSERDDWDGLADERRIVEDVLASS